MDVNKENFFIALNEDQSLPKYNARTAIPCKIIGFNSSVIINHAPPPHLQYIAQSASEYEKNVKIFKF